jgi:hypothetical protein
MVLMKKRQVRILLADVDSKTNGRKFEECGFKQSQDIVQWQ